jgi:hypothetical protein
MFSIYLTDEFVPESEGQAAYGKLHIEEYAETFITSFVSWTAADYERHWQEACERLIAGENESALIVSYVPPTASEFLVWWPLYREGDIVHVRNELVLYSQMKVPFSIVEPWFSIRERKILTDEGSPISEWDTNLPSIREFLEQNQGPARR